ncbi:hypothetical protein [Evansella clarkii]|uniref:hypothetical protein n=1 Tax=Evansella clarkii TaxID=79879 RepID=UPI000B43B3E6|nr:hypothetical protein [Evansella clarkii]
MLEKIIWWPASNDQVDKSHFRSWKYFIKSIHGPRIKAFSLDPGVALLVKALSAAAITTNSCCDGHGRKAPEITFYGRYNAAWFLVLFNNMEKSDLNYCWEIENKTGKDIDVKGNSPSDKWEIKKVMEDTLKIADYFLVNADKFSRIKREIFFRNRNSTSKYLKQLDFNQLVEWMEDKYLEYTQAMTNDYTIVEKGKVRYLSKEEYEKLGVKIVEDIVKDMSPEELQKFQKERYEKFIKPLMDHNINQLKDKKTK